MQKRQRLTEIQVLTKDITQEKEINAVSLISQLEGLPLIHSQINLIKFVKSWSYIL